MGILETLAKSFPPERLLAMLNNMSPAEVERAFDQAEPQIEPAIFLAIVRSVSKGMARRYPNVGARS